MPTLETERLVLRPFTTSDAAEVQRMAGTWEVYISTLNVPHPYPDGAAERWIASHLSTFLDGDGLCLAVTRAEDRVLLGAVGLTADRRHNKAEMGYWIGPEHWGEGYCTEAARALVAYGLGSLHYHKITARHLVDNPASGRVMQKVGMVKEGTLIEDVFKEGKYHSLEVYAIINPDPHAPAQE